MKIENMDHYVLPIVTLLCMVVVGGHASTIPEIYWKNVLPNTPMPLAVTKLLPHPASASQLQADVGTIPVSLNNGYKNYAASASQLQVDVGTIPISLNNGYKNYATSASQLQADVGTIQVSMNNGYKNYAASASNLQVDVGKIPASLNLGNKNYAPSSSQLQVDVGTIPVSLNNGYKNYAASASQLQVDVGTIPISLNNGYKNYATSASQLQADVGTIPVSMNNGYKNYAPSSSNLQVDVGNKPASLNLGKRNYVAYASQLQIDATRALFFLEKDMKVGSHMTFEFTKTLNGAPFLTREEANALPFSSDKMPEILQHFSFKPDSIDAKTVQNTIKDCETKANPGEEKYCATSLESMVDFATSTIGNNIKAISTVVKNNNHQVDKYTIVRVKKTAREEDKNIVCHKEDYAYAVFYCHKTTSSSSYVVSLVGSNGSTVNAVSICHKDTSSWNPKHLAFQILKVKPGTVPVCHILSEQNIMWVPNN